MVNGRRELDLLPSVAIVWALFDAEDRVLPTVRTQAEAIAQGAELIAARLCAGGRLLLAGAGTSGRLALAQAAELPGTFGVDHERVQARVAGGIDSDDRDEDDLRLAEADRTDLAAGAGDALIAVAASGRTPYTLHIAGAARDAGATVIAVVTATDTPLGTLADVAVVAEVGPEVLRGSTRLSAGTAQKLALDALTTTAMVRLGRVHDDLMIDVVAANAKLRARSADIVAEIADCGNDAATDAISACGGSARAAVLCLEFGLPPGQALAAAARHRSLRDAVDAQRS
jgi:N-acetylmuramic acid 6-phosphate etherase